MLCVCVLCQCANVYKDYADMEKEVVVAVALVVFVVGGEGVTADNNTTIQLLHCWIPTDNLGILFFVGGKMGERFEVLWGEGPCVCVCVHWLCRYCCYQPIRR